MNFIVRWKYRLAYFMAGADAMNRRVKVEQHLLDCANGKQPLPDANKCRELALYLGTPTAEIGSRHHENNDGGHAHERSAAK